ncbi:MULTISPECIES: tRNA(Met) cytidine acetyltransferase TmcA [Lelliottia]|uniref:tRNA(Met) cytidine acetyltransferase TmcA n=1 Tax=Lelliottia aquatilis TaxID=2080838 RepID=A0ABX4ZZT8_9ENTR|nr:MULTISPECIES: GNAT family N-acetyltransferase [Lelliottia]POZ19081.1 tRNA cytosine(34) acetyltransferase TmcA [Lelliottia sp. 7254-16]POZ21945.1 tRNA cytosine(34) acetyltransferase TmcA [Lelliottia aquatilis]POZ24559.1 tRNA cytosine(34) acetyltransferase TmcA [Lelliottia aquatilis]POZ31858.1 tRNA cytosine(34) acetyltransferase TmcA [Lelliottia aquatilis]POZ37684.1 tRNA cytosine(34) acetyltransferase TmcA [Lelliottia aquatilis]
MVERLAARLQREGHRRLLVISGDDTWSQTQALSLRDVLVGDWLWVGNDAPVDPSCAPQALKNLLGREYHHAIFDARRGFDVSAFAALSGTLRAGSLLVLLTPPFSVWPEKPDSDSVRWSDSEKPIATPHFVRHFCRTVSHDPDMLVWQQHQPFPDFTLPPAPDWQPASGEPQREQAEILAALLEMNAGVAVVTAPRGRGKSALAGMLLSRIPGRAIVTAPAKGATEVIARFAADNYHFMAPDALLASDQQADWLIVDEAAAIPGPLLEQLVSRFPRVLLTTTVQGYEGTGRGFLLKFCARFSGLKHFTLSAPIRWAAGCPLERVVANALLFDDVVDETAVDSPEIIPLEQNAWESQPQLAADIYTLLCSAHYRTSPLDLRRMMDAPGQHFAVARAGDGLVGALWLVDEGGLAPQLSQAVWAGYRRPRGNLVAQSLAAHGGSPLAATLIGRRVTRVAVHPARQREGIGQSLVLGASHHAQQDYLSVSFGYTQELWRFWQRCGFVLVRMGTHREASSGCYTAMALKPISEAGQALCAQEHQRLCRDARIIEKWNAEKIPVDDCWESTLNDDDWLELGGFAFAHRPLSTSAAALTRLLLAVDLPLQGLRGKLENDNDRALSGRKALLAQQRSEAEQALDFIDSRRSQQLKTDILQWQFFQ